MVLIFFFAIENSREIRVFSSFKPVICDTNFSGHCLSRECGTYTFYNFLLAL